MFRGPTISIQNNYLHSQKENFGHEFLEDLQNNTKIGAWREGHIIVMSLPLDILALHGTWEDIDLLARSDNKALNCCVPQACSVMQPWHQSQLITLQGP